MRIEGKCSSSQRSKESADTEINHFPVPTFSDLYSRFDATEFLPSARRGINGLGISEVYCEGILRGLRI